MKIMTWDRAIGIAAVLAGIPAILDLFKGERTREGLLFGALSLLILGVLIYRRWEEKQPLFSYIEIQKELMFLDAAGNVATMETNATTKANHTGIQQLWFRNINADGDVKNFTVDSIATSGQRKAGSWEVCKQFDRPLHRGDIVSVTLKYELHQAFPGPTEGLTHVTATKTNKLVVRIRFHDSKIGHNPIAFIGKGSDVEEPLDSPKALDNGKTVEMVIDKPKVGTYYTIEWRW
jgi:hypothetical protein